MTVEELGQRMSGAEFSEWLALENIEPWSDARTDIHFGRLLEMLFRLNVSKKDWPAPGAFVSDWWGEAAIEARKRRDEAQQSGFARFIERLANTPMSSG
jgi:hypothetical protein